MTENNRNQVSPLNTDLLTYFNGGKHLALKLTLSVIYNDADLSCDFNLYCAGNCEYGENDCCCLF